VGAVLDLLVGLDQESLRLARGVEWAPLTALFVLSSSFWVKGPLLVALGLAADLRERRRVPLVALATLVGALVASGVVTLLKALVDRARPAVSDPSVAALVATPESASFPSGHAGSAFGAATALAILCPRLRVPVLAVAVLVALSRVYLRVHYGADVLAGVAVGIVAGALVAAAGRRVGASVGVAR
jgi:undecaprenyl-diphosphatase